MKKRRNEELCIRAQAGDTAARDHLLENNIGIIRKFAHEAYEDMNLKNSDLGLDFDDLVQEGSIGLLEAIPLYDPDRGIKFLSFAAPFIRNAMTDLVRSALSQYEQRLTDRGEMRIYLNDENLDDDWHKRILSIPDPQATMPEAYCIEKENREELCRAWDTLTDREQAYLRYRFGFADDTPHTLIGTAIHFRLSESRAKITEEQALDNLWVELPWWY